MERFIRQENPKHLRELLARTTDKTECQRIVKLIEEEEANERATGAEAPTAPTSQSQKLICIKLRCQE